MESHTTLCGLIIWYQIPPKIQCNSNQIPIPWNLVKLFLKAFVSECKCLD